MSRWNLAWLVAVPAAVVAGLVVVGTAPEPDADYKLVRTVVDVLAEVDKSYVRELTPDEKQKLVEAMVNGGLERLDPHSQYLSAGDYERFTAQSDGRFGGVGIVIVKDPDTGRVVVESPIAGSPAYAAGVLPGDVILKVDGAAVGGLTSDEVRAKIKGVPGTAVVLTVGRDGAAARDVALDRAVIEVHPVKGVARTAADPLKWDWFADPARQVALVRLVTFSEKSDKEVRAAVEEAEKAGAKALILDLRDNPGGLLSQAAAVADLFLTAGPIVGTATKRGGDGTAVPTRTLSARADGTIFEPAADRPMAVLGRSVQRQRRGDRGGGPAGPQAGGRRRRADLRQGERAEDFPARRRGGGQADDRDLADPGRQEHPPLPGLEGRRRVGGQARPRAGGETHGRRPGGVPQTRPRDRLGQGQAGRRVPRPRSSRRRSGC